MVWVPVPTADGVKVVEQLSGVLAAGRRMLKLMKEPAPLLLKLTVPVGVLLVPASVSLTVAVQVVGWPTTTDAGLQLTLVLVERFAVTITVVVPELPEWVLSPP